MSIRPRGGYGHECGDDLPCIDVCRSSRDDGTGRANDIQHMEIGREADSLVTEGLFHQCDNIRYLQLRFVVVAFRNNSSHDHQTDSNEN